MPLFDVSEGWLAPEPPWVVLRKEGSDWSGYGILEDAALFGSPEDLAARLTALGKRLMDALERPPQSGDPGFGGGG